jgi:hypothetical protein
VPATATSIQNIRWFSNADSGLVAGFYNRVDGLQLSRKACTQAHLGFATEASGCQNRRLDFQKLGLHEGAILADSGLGADVQFYREPLALEANKNVSPLLAGRPSANFGSPRA